MNPAKAKRNTSTIANVFQRHLRQPLQSEHCRSQRFYRHSVFSLFLTEQPEFNRFAFISPVETMSAP